MTEGGDIAKNLSQAKNPLDGVAGHDLRPR
jgi:hypothetical protein